MEASNLTLDELRRCTYTDGMFTLAYYLCVIPVLALVIAFPVVTLWGVHPLLGVCAVLLYAAAVPLHLKWLAHRARLEHQGLD